MTGSLNASLAQWLMREGLAPVAYVATQGSALQRAGHGSANPPMTTDPSTVDSLGFVS